MTSHDPNSPLERYFEAFGDAARHAADASQTRRSRSRRRRSVFALGVSATAVIAVAVALPTGGNRLSTIEQAAAALAPEGAIVHMQVRFSEREGESAASQTIEQWSAADPLRWRLTQDVNLAVGRAVDRTGQPISGKQEVSYENGIVRRFLVKRNVLDVDTGTSPANGPSLFGFPRRGDPAQELRQAEASGEVADYGTKSVDGRRVRQLTATRNVGGLQRDLVYNVDPETFAPVSGTLTIDASPTIVIAFEVLTYERVPLNEATERLLTIKTNASTKVRQLDR